MLYNKEAIAIKNHYNIMSKNSSIIFSGLVVAFLIVGAGLVAINIVNPSIVHASTVGFAAYSSSENNQGDLYSFAVVGGPATTSGTLYKQIGSGNWSPTSNWIQTDGSGNDSKGPWPCSNGADDPAVNVYIAWPDGTQTNTVSHHCNYQTQSGQGTFTINVKVGEYTLSNPDSLSNARDPLPEEIPGFSYDIERIIGQGASTTISVVVSNAAINNPYSVPANTPGIRDNYEVIFKNTPENLGQPACGIAGCPTFTVQSGQNTTVNLSYAIYFNWSPLEPVTVQMKGDIVDYKGDFVRNLTDEEKNQVQFDVKEFNSVRNVGGDTGAFDNAGISTAVFPFPSKLKDYQNVPCFNDIRGSANVHGYKILDVKSPNGYVLRSINGSGWVEGNRFKGSSSVAEALWDKYQDILGPWTPPEPTIVVFHFTQLGTSQAKKVDSVPFIAGSSSGLDFVKRIAQTYSDKEGLYLEIHDDWRVAKNQLGEKPYPAAYKIAVFNGKPYLFLNAEAQIQIYDINSPASPTLVENFKVASIPGFTVGNSYNSGINLASSSPWPMATKIAVADNSPYVLVELSYAGSTGIAILSLNTQEMTLSPIDGAIALSLFSGNNQFIRGPIGTYTANNKTYFISSLPDKSAAGDSVLGITAPGGGWFYSIYSLNASGKVELKKIIQLTNSNLDGATFSLVNNKPYLFVPSLSTTNSTLNIYDLSDPSSVVLTGKINLKNSSLDKMVLDVSQKRLYIAYYGYGTAGYAIDVYDLTNMGSPKLTNSFTDIVDLLKINESSPAIVELKNRLKIPQSTPILDFAQMEKSPNTLVYSLAANDGTISVAIQSGIKFPGQDLADQTEYSDYSTTFIQIYADVKNLSSPKILGTMLSRQIIFSASGSMPSTSEQVTRNNSSDDPFAIIYRSRYLYRANVRTADAWEFKNIAATAAPAGGGGGGSVPVPGNTCM